MEQRLLLEDHAILSLKIEAWKPGHQRFWKAVVVHLVRDIGPRKIIA
jgi:hypothetical protein